MAQIVKLQLALFFQNPILRPDKLMDGINSSMENLFDTMPQILPIPSEMSPDIPRVQMHSKNRNYHCNIACSRVDFILNGDSQDEAAWSNLTMDFVAKLKLFINSVFEQTKIIRFGLIGTFWIPDKSAITSITNKYFKVHLNSAEEINLRFNKRNSRYGYKLNNITSINHTIEQTDDQANQGILIELDVNNVPTAEHIKSEIMLQLIEDQMQSFLPAKVKVLVE
jgi:hypothetical protein